MKKHNILEIVNSDTKMSNRHSKTPLTPYTKTTKSKRTPKIKKDSESWYKEGIKYKEKAHTLQNNYMLKKALECFQKSKKLQDDTLTSHHIDVIKCHINFQNDLEAYEEGRYDGPSLVRLGNCYAQGIGTQIDEKDAYSFYEKAVKFKNMDAVLNLAICYSYGKGCCQNQERAIELYDQAHRMGHPLAEVNKKIFLERIKSYK